MQAIQAGSIFLAGFTKKPASGSGSGFQCKEYEFPVKGWFLAEKIGSFFIF
jgi:hypothetical protein